LQSCGHLWKANNIVHVGLPPVREMKRCEWRGDGAACAMELSVQVERNNVR
jgi:hypothetical protein